MRTPSPPEEADTNTAGYAARWRFYRTETDDATADQPFLQSLMGRGVRTVLEVPCGAGRNAHWLAASGRRAVLADLQHGMLQQSRERIRALGRAGTRLHVAQADLRALPFAGAFDLALVPGEGFQLVHGDGAVRALRSLRHAIAADGRVLVDVYGFPGRAVPGDTTRPAYYEPAVADGVTVTEWTRPLPGGGRLSRCRTQRHTGAFVDFDLTYRLDSAGRQEDRRAAMRLERYTAGKLLSRAEAAGLEPERVLAGYDGRAHTGTEPRVIALLRRRGT